MKIFPAIILVFFLSACRSAWIAELVTQHGQALYHDEFSDPASGWIQASSAEGTLGYTHDAYRMLVKSPGYDLRAVSGHDYGDVQVEVDAALQEGPLNNRFGLICRYRDEDNFYSFMISSDGYYAIAKVKDGAASLLGQEMMAYSGSIHQGREINHLRFDCVGSTLYGYVNGQPIAISEDADFPNGDAGLISGAFDEGGVYICFEHFMVIKP